MDKAEAQRFGVSLRQEGSLIFKGLDMTQVDSLEIGVFASARMNHTGGQLEVRLEDAQGALIGQADVAAPAPATPGFRGGFSRTLPLHISLMPQSGLQDLCLVFFNPEAREDQPLMSVSVLSLHPLITQSKT